MGNFEKAIKYVSENIDMVDVDYAAYKMGRYRCPLTMINPSLADSITEYMDEWGEEHELPEDWWIEMGDVDDILYKLCELSDGTV